MFIQCECISSLIVIITPFPNIKLNSVAILLVVTQQEATMVKKIKIKKKLLFGF